MSVPTKLVSFLTRFNDLELEFLAQKILVGTLAPRTTSEKETMLLFHLRSLNKNASLASIGTKQQQNCEQFMSFKRLKLIGHSFLKYIMFTHLHQRFDSLPVGMLNDKLIKLCCSSRMNRIGNALQIRMIFWDVLNEKTVAGIVHALIGAYFVHFGETEALEFLQRHLHIEITPPSSPPCSPSSPMSNLFCPDQVDGKHLCEREDAFTVTEAFAVSNLEQWQVELYAQRNFAQLEKIICYRFKNKALLLEAFMHASFMNNANNSYQRLEFMGDAVLQHCIALFLFATPCIDSSRTLLDISQYLLNNKFLSSLTVKFEFYKFLLINTTNWKLKETILEYVEKFQSTMERDQNGWNRSEAPLPKLFADVVEALAGAIYLDSGMSLHTVWRVFHRLMKDMIDEKFLLM